MRSRTSRLAKQSLGGVWGVRYSNQILDGTEPLRVVAYASIRKGCPSFEARGGNVSRHDEHSTGEVEQICVCKQA